MRPKIVAALPLLLALLSVRPVAASILTPDLGASGRGHAGRRQHLRDPQLRGPRRPRPVPRPPHRGSRADLGTARSRRVEPGSHPLVAREPWLHRPVPDLLDQQQHPRPRAARHARRARRDARTRVDPVRRADPSRRGPARTLGTRRRRVEPHDDRRRSGVGPVRTRRHRHRGRLDGHGRRYESSGAPGQVARREQLVEGLLQLTSESVRRSRARHPHDRHHGGRRRSGSLQPGHRRRLQREVHLGQGDRRRQHVLWVGDGPERRPVDARSGQQPRDRRFPGRRQQQLGFLHPEFGAPLLDGRLARGRNRSRVRGRQPRPGGGNGDLAGELRQHHRRGRDGHRRRDRRLLLARTRPGRCGLLDRQARDLAPGAGVLRACPAGSTVRGAGRRWRRPTCPARWR